MRFEKLDNLYHRRTRKFIKRLSGLVLGEHVTLEAVYGWSAEPTPFAERSALDYKPLNEGDVWGAVWESAWVNLKGTIPADWAGKTVVAELDFNGEALVVSDEGVPLQGLTNQSVFTPVSAEGARTLFPLSEAAEGGEAIDLWVEAAANGLFGATRDGDAAKNAPQRHGAYTGQAKTMKLRIFHPSVFQFWADMDVLFQLSAALPEHSVRRRRILRGLSEAIDMFKDDVSQADASREVLAPLLASPAMASSVKAVSIGHAHIDTAWLWPLRESIRKVGRTFASQIDLINRYPDYIFGASQPQLYQFAKDHYPALYEKIKSAVKAGRWELQGAMWVEADCNLISGESMVRQVLHGKNFFMDEFGVDVKNLWIPDVFGYAASTPQIMRKAGVDYFLTQKISWSQFNRFPHTTFNWRGIDGTELLTHFPPEGTYNSRLEPESLCKAEEKFCESDQLDEMLVLFGIGDGGGGPKPEHIENGLRMADLEGCPRVAFGRADDFFERLSVHADTLPVWVGELYLERHRGTLTTQARTKRGNRKGELALRETEFLWSCLDAAQYPQADLDLTWKVLLTNQFHDIIPGSSIKLVYDRAEKEYAEGLARCRLLVEQAAGLAFTADDSSMVLVNTLNVAWSGAVTLPEGWQGASLVGQTLDAQVEEGKRVTAHVTIPSQSALTLIRAQSAVDRAAGEALVLENDQVRYVFNTSGQITEAFDKGQGRAILSDGGLGNVVTLYEDRPVDWDAWDIDIYYENMVLETARGVSVARVADGPVRQGLRFELEVGASRLVQYAFLEPNTKQLDFETEVEWNECHRMLRTAFDVNVFASEASYEIQYGYVKRPTHRNTTWDFARFEVAAQRYADLSDLDYGVALLNDCKYGHKIHDNVIDLNLLRSPTEPDPDADQGAHRFTYSILPHVGGLIEAQIPDAGARLNQPPIELPGYSGGESLVPPVTLEGQGVELGALKKAEKDDSLIVRVIERYGRSTTATLRINAAGKQLCETDLMEWNDSAPLSGDRIEVVLKPFEIRTFRLA